MSTTAFNFVAVQRRAPKQSTAWGWSFGLAPSSASQVRQIALVAEPGVRVGVLPLHVAHGNPGLPVRHLALETGSTAT